MGLAVPIALGVALAQPQRRVVALEGDGSILMQLGCLGTVAALAPPNLAIIVMDNASYQITGGQPTATAFKSDIVAIAKGAGLRQSDWAADEEDYERLLARALSELGPWLLAARIDGAPGVGTTDRNPPRIRDNFMRGLGQAG
jgi:thiamine pyrophosphate-dependent acetolactate synthase large subunit-like protein